MNALGTASVRSVGSIYVGDPGHVGRTDGVARHCALSPQEKLPSSCSFPAMDAKTRSLETGCKVEMVASCQGPRHHAAHPELSAPSILVGNGEVQAILRLTTTRGLGQCALRA